MDKERLKVLLYNAIVVIQEYIGNDYNLEEEIGITQEEYQEVMEEEYENSYMG